MSQDPHRFTYLLVSHLPDGTRADRAIVASIRQRLWDSGTTGFRADKSNEAETLFRSHQETIGAVFVVARSGDDLPWEMMEMANARRVPQFIVSRSALDVDRAKVLGKTVFVERPERAGIADEPIDSELELFLASLPSGAPQLPIDGTRRPAVRIILPEMHPVDASHCLPHELATLKVIANSYTDGISLLQLGAELSQDGQVQSMSLAVNSLKRKGLIRARLPMRVARGARVPEDTLCVTSAGRRFLGGS